MAPEEERRRLQVEKGWSPIYSQYVMFRSCSHSIFARLALSFVGRMKMNPPPSFVATPPIPLTHESQTNPLPVATHTHKHHKQFLDRIVDIHITIELNPVRFSFSCKTAHGLFRDDVLPAPFF